MGRLIAQTLVTLDGVTQAPGGKDEDTRDGFAAGGWVPQFVDDDFLANAKAMYSRARGFVLGRGTYEQFAYWWPQRPTEGDPVSLALNTLPKHVASRTLKEPDLAWTNSHLLQGPVEEAVPRVKEEVDGDILVAGSVDLMQTLMRHNLVDEYQVMVFPVVVGPGHQLFREPLPFTLRLSDCKITSTGAAIMTYLPAGPREA